MFEGVSAWGAICQLLTRIGCTVKADLTAAAGSQFTIVQIGADDADSDAILSLAAPVKIHDAEYLSNTRGRIPGNVLVHFRKQHESSPHLLAELPYTVLITSPDDSAEDVIHPIWDDMIAVYNGGSLVNGSALNDRANARAADFYRGLEEGGNRLWKRYAGLV